MDNVGTKHAIIVQQGMIGCEDGTRHAIKVGNSGSSIAVKPRIFLWLVLRCNSSLSINKQRIESYLMHCFMI